MVMCRTGLLSQFSDIFFFSIASKFLLVFISPGNSLAGAIIASQWQLTAWQAIYCISTI